MKRTDTVIVGAGQAGLAMSRCLSDLGIDHVVLERGRVAERWRSERWDSLRLLTPNWQSRLPGFRYDGPEPDGFMTRGEVIGFFERYAISFAAPVEPETTVLDVSPASSGFRVSTTSGVWTARTVVIATGHCDVPFVPGAAARLPGHIHQVTPCGYRNPDQLPPGLVLVVGASASGIQLAEEILASGRPVTLATGSHTRVPRQYRGRDIMWWLDRAGVLDETAEQVYDLDISRDQPSLQLVGGPAGATLNLPVLQERGVQVVGRMVSAGQDGVTFADDLVATTAAADVKLAALLKRLDSFAVHDGMSGALDRDEPFEPSWPSFIEAPAPRYLRAGDIGTVVWATGFRRRYPWLKAPVLDRRGEIRHAGGVTPCPGLYVIGLQFLRKRNSNFIDGVGADAVALAAQIDGYLARPQEAIA